MAGKSWKLTNFKNIGKIKFTKLHIWVLYEDNLKTIMAWFNVKGFATAILIPAIQEGPECQWRSTIWTAGYNSLQHFLWIIICYIVPLLKLNVKISFTSRILWWFRWGLKFMCTCVVPPSHACAPCWTQALLSDYDAVSASVIIWVPRC